MYWYPTTRVIKYVCTYMCIFLNSISNIFFYEKNMMHFKFITINFVCYNFVKHCHYYVIIGVKSDNSIGFFKRIVIRYLKVMLLLRNRLLSSGPLFCFLWSQTIFIPRYQISNRLHLNTFITKLSVGTKVP